MNRSAPAPTPAARNPGPSWGFAFIVGCDRCLPDVILHPLRRFGSAIAVLLMPAQRAHSRAYLARLRGRPVRWREVVRHFDAFAEFLMLKLRVMRGVPHEAMLGPGAAEFVAFSETHGQALLGSFHLGHSDLIGFLLGARHRQKIVMIRQRVGNSGDTDGLEKRFGEWIRIIWVNQESNLLFRLKEAVADGSSVALKCDRLEFTAKTEVFTFLGAPRRFPFTIYHLALIFDLPVMFSYGVPGPDGGTVVHASPAWVPDPKRSKTENLATAHRHFQAVLTRVEDLLRQHPYQWFNFLPLNPEAT